MYLGLDFGTSSVKGVLIDAKQKIVATASAPLKVSRPQPGWSEQNPEDWWRACNIVVKALGKMKPKAIAAVEGIGLSGQQHGATLLGKDGKAGDKGSRQRGGGFFRRRKVCKFCADKIDDINYKDVKLLGAFVPERGKILPRRISGTCAMHQRKLQTAIKRARQLALLPYVTD